MLQGIIVVIILCAALFVVLRRFWQTTRRVSKGECACTGCRSGLEEDSQPRTRP
jgi:hypothetical protein